MASYTKINNEEARLILEIYGLKPKNITLDALSDGISNSNYRVQMDDEVRLLKISNDKNATQLQSEHTIVNWLHDKGFPLVVAPYQTINQSTVYTFGDYTGALFPYIENEPYQKNTENLKKLGAALASLHMVSINEKNLENQGIRSHKSVGYGIKQILNYIEKSQCPKDFKAAFEKIYPDQAAMKLVDLDLPGGIIHGDFYFDNALFVNNQLMAMLDFEQAGIGRFILDLGIAISGSAAIDNVLQNDFINAYIKGYESIRKLTTKESELIHDAILIGLFSISLWRIKRFTEGNIDSSKKDSYQELLLRALKYHQGL